MNSPLPSPLETSRAWHVFLAGAAGAVGRRLVPLLLQAGYRVTGTTRSVEKAAQLQQLGVDPVIVDMFDQERVFAAVATARPDVIVHQLTDLPAIFDAAAMEAARARNARLREVVTPLLMAAAQHVGVRRMIVQSICFAYEAGPLPHTESDPVSVPSVRALENAALTTDGVEGIVLRYGRFWGPGTWTDRPQGDAPVHVDAAAQAALLAITQGTHGVYNIAEDDGTVAIDKARQDLGFDPAFRP